MTAAKTGVDIPMIVPSSDEPDDPSLVSSEEAAVASSSSAVEEDAFEGVERVLEPPLEVPTASDESFFAVALATGAAELRAGISVGFA